MVLKKKYLLFFVILLFIVIEIVFLLVSNNKNVFEPTVSLKKPAPTIPPIQQGAQFGDLPIGYYLSSIGNSSFIMLGLLDDVSLKDNGDIVADISFGLNKGYGEKIHHQFLLYTKNKFIHGIILIKANELSLTLQGKDQKAFSLNPTKQPTEAMKTLQTYVNQKAMFTFWTTISPPGKKIAVTNSQPTITDDRINSLISCNMSFLTSLNTSTKISDCTPYIQSLTVYDKNF